MLVWGVVGSVAGGGGIARRPSVETASSLHSRWQGQATQTGKAQRSQTNVNIAAIKTTLEMRRQYTDIRPHYIIKDIISYHTSYHNGQCTCTPGPIQSIKNSTASCRRCATARSTTGSTSAAVSERMCLINAAGCGRPLGAPRRTASSAGGTVGGGAGASSLVGFRFRCCCCIRERNALTDALTAWFTWVSDRGAIERLNDAFWE